MKRRITLVVDDDERRRQGLGPFSRGCVIGLVNIESDEPVPEPVPEPDRVQEFSVRIVTKRTDRRVSTDYVCSLFHLGPYHPENVTVTEVES